MTTTDLIASVFASDPPTQSLWRSLDGIDSAWLARLVDNNFGQHERDLTNVGMVRGELRWWIRTLATREWARS